MASCADIESNIAKFQLAAAYVKGIAHELDSNSLLYFYARFKQVNEGPCNTSAPSFIDFSGKQKWRAWKNLENMDKTQAMMEYIEMLTEMRPSWNKEGDEGKSSSAFGISVSKLQQEEEEELCEEDKTAFDWVKENNLTKLRELLRENKLNLDDKDEEGLTYLHWACDRGHTDAVKFLLENGACINSQDNEGLTPLHYACSCEHESVVSCLLRNGANASLEDHEGCTAINSTSNTVIIDLLSK